MSRVLRPNAHFWNSLGDDGVTGVALDGRGPKDAAGDFGLGHLPVWIWPHDSTDPTDHGRN